MSNLHEAPSTEAGSSSHSRFPFSRTPPAAESPTEREATVLSQPRSGDSKSSEGGLRAPGSSVSPSPTSLKLFPQQQQPEVDADIAGETLGHFEIRRRIGAGGMGTVFLADDTKLQRQVALKVLSPGQTADPASVQRFLNEARSAARLDHDHVARVFFYGDDHGLHYIAYEYVQGHNLRDLIRARGRIEPAEVVAFAVQLTDALRHTSAMGVVHRDIKPSNIIITNQGKAKLVDLGLARQESLNESAQLTVAGTTLGTFDYISPEQAKDPRNVDVRSDIYSLGCTLYHALTGEPPFPEGTVLQRLLHHHDKEPPDPSLKNRRVSPAVAAVIRKMMAADPRRRYPTADALLHDLLLIAAAMGLRTSNGDQPPLSRLLQSSTRNWAPWAGWLTAAVSLVLGAAIWQAWPQQTWLQSSGTGDQRGTVAQRPGTTANDDELDRPAFVRRDSLDTPWDQPAAGTGGSTTTPLLPLPGTLADGIAGGLGTPTPSGVSPLPDPIGGPLFRDDPLVFPAGAERTPRPNGTGSTVATTPSSDSSISGGMTNSAASSARDEILAAIDRTGGRGATSGDLPPPSETAPLPTSSAPYVIAGSARSFTSLEAACAEIRDQGTIELQFDGRLPEPERPLRLVGKRVTLQAARGRRPVLWFAPKDTVTDPLQSRMIVLSGGSLTLSNVSVELQIRQPASVDRWALFRLERPERLRLDDAFITVVNPTNAAVSIIECVSPASSFVKMGAMKDNPPQMTTEVIIDQSVLRGEANGIWVQDAAAYRLRLRRSLFTFAEWLVQCEPPREATMAQLRVGLEIEHCTAILGQGMLRCARIDEMLARQPALEISAHSNLFSCGPGAPFIEQVFSQEVMELRQPRFGWSSERNRFDDLETLWLARFDGRSDEDRWDFEAWRNFWSSAETARINNRPVSRDRRWRTAEWSRLSPIALREDIIPEDPAGGLGLDEAGVFWDLLPPEPPVLATRTP